MFRCMFRIVCLDECLGFTLRKIIFQKNVNNITQTLFHNKPWDPKSHCISFYFLNQILMNLNHTLTFILQNN